MTKIELKELAKNRIVIMDGATGSELIKVGMPVGYCPEKWILDNKEVLINLQREYVEAGSDIVLAPTFTANRIKLAEYSLENQIETINKKLVSLSKEAVNDKAYVAGDMSMTGISLKPLGDVDFEILVDVYKQQAKILYEAGVDLFVVETMMSLQECRACVIAIKEICDLPIIVSLTYNDDGRTLYGTTPEIATVTLQSMGVDVVGVNCSKGPKDLKSLVEAMSKVSNVPIMAKPNAGLPKLIDGESCYDMNEIDFAKGVEELMMAGASFVGGCCGTTPKHIKEVYKVAQNHKPQICNNNKRMVTSERMLREIDLDGRFIVVGERINPTGKKKLQEELRAGSLDMVVDFAISQEEAGADILDINMGTNGINEKEMMINAIYEVTSVSDLPLCIDTSYPEVMEAALRIYPGRALINSISAETEKLEKILPIAKKYGAMFIALPLSDKGLPKDIKEKKSNIDLIIDWASKYELYSDDMIIDILVTTVGANQYAAKDCFELIELCKNDLKIPTICGLSNISFGMPSRQFVNNAFLNIALSKGLTMAILNPSQEMLMYTALGADLLLCKEEALDKYLETVPNKTLEIKKVNDLKKVDNENDDKIFNAVVKGDKKNIVKFIESEINNGNNPKEIVDVSLIKGINEVGRLYDEKKYFLPQLIAGANAMQEGMNYLEQYMMTDNNDRKETIIMATVEGDIHDIGKNLVALMLKNYGYNVIDLGKDVEANKIVSAAIENDADIIGLSALMTTTMMKMKEVVLLAKEKDCNAKIIIGGACITESFADEIGADAFSTDASDCVKVVGELLK